MNIRPWWTWILVGLWIVGVAGVVGLGQEKLSVIVNEFGQGRAGNGEWIELLVIGAGPGTAVDLRGWVLQDRQGDSRGGVFITFADHPAWAAVPAGTLIVLYNYGDKGNLPEHFPADDLDFSDFVAVLPADAPELFTTSRWEGLANAGDLIILLDAQGVVIHSLSYGGVGEGEKRPLHLPDVGRTTAAGYTGATVEGVANPENWQVGPDAPESSTPGAPNNENQRAWVEALQPRP